MPIESAPTTSSRETASHQAGERDRELLLTGSIPREYLALLFTLGSAAGLLYPFFIFSATPWTATLVFVSHGWILTRLWLTPANLPWSLAVNAGLVILICSALVQSDNLPRAASLMLALTGGMVSIVLVLESKDCVTRVRDDRANR